MKREMIYSTSISANWYRLFLRIAIFVCAIWLLLASCTDDGTDLNLSEVTILSPEEVDGSPIAFVNTNVIPMVTETVLTNQTVIVSDGKIIEIGPSESVSIDNNVVQIDTEGKGYLVPGLMDMHYHRSSSNDLFLFTANGVTLVREMWGSTSLLAFRDRIIDENIPVPQIVVASPGMDGTGGPLVQFTPYVTDPSNARELVAQYKFDGFDFIKVYNRLEKEVYEAIISEAIIQKIPVIGHVPSRVGPLRTFQSGQRSVEHFIGYGYHASSANTMSAGTLNMSQVNSLVDLSIDNDVWHVPTITVNVMSKAGIEIIKSSEEYQYISSYLEENFRTQPFSGLTNSEQSDRNHKDVLNTINSKGGNIMLGTDAGFGYVIPGFSIHEELMHFVDGGLSNFEALKAATVNPSIFLKLESEVGTIEVGKRADMILLESNPLENIAATEDRAGVLLRGRWFSETRLRSDLASLNEE